MVPNCLILLLQRHPRALPYPHPNVVLDLRRDRMKRIVAGTIIFILGPISYTLNPRSFDTIASFFNSPTQILGTLQIVSSARRYYLLGVSVQIRGSLVINMQLLYNLTLLDALQWPQHWLKILKPPLLLDCPCLRFLGLDLYLEAIDILTGIFFERHSVSLLIVFIKL